MGYITILLILFSSLAFAEGTITIATGEWAPYSGEKNPNQGLVTEIVVAVFHDMKQELIVQFYPWKRCEENVHKGRNFATFPYYKTAGREEMYYFSDPIVFSRSVLFFLKSRFPEGIKWEKLEDLKKYYIGGSLGNWYNSVFKSIDLNVDYASSDELSFKKLKIGRVDLVPTDEAVGWQHVKILLTNINLYSESMLTFVTVASNSSLMLIKRDVTTHP